MAKKIVPVVAKTIVPHDKSIAEIVADYFALVEAEAQEAGVIGFMARAMVQATMPHSKRDSNEFIRKNGRFQISMYSPVGLPYGALPRLITSWMTTEAVKTKSRDLVLGDSLNDFMRKLNLVATGGRWGTITSLKTQMKRLTSCSITCTYDSGNHFAMDSVKPVERAVLWWNPISPEQKTLWQSTLTLSESFFKEITSKPIPIRLSTLEKLKGSSMALDVYCWLTYRNFYTKTASRIPWVALQMQFGAGYPLTHQGKRHFKFKFLEALQKVGEAYPEAFRLQEEQDVLVFVPGRPDIEVNALGS